MKLNKKFYLQDNVVCVAAELIGKTLFTNLKDRLTGGIITETEAYNGITDKASHAYNGRRAPRTEVMYSEGGIAYVYLCYGLHALFNVVTNNKEIPQAVLIRAIKPITGIETMKKRRGAWISEKELCNGPGTVSQALGIQISHSGTDLGGKNIFCLKNYPNLFLKINLCTK